MRIGISAGKHPSSFLGILDESLKQMKILEDYEYAPFEPAARRRIHDPGDWPSVAAALTLKCPVWTEDFDFFGTGLAVWDTRRVEILLQSLAGEGATIPS